MKKRNWVIASILVSSLGLAGVAHACKGHSGGGHEGSRGDRMMHTLKKLDLTDEQRQAVSEITDASRDQMKARRDEMSTIRKALKEQGRAATFDAGAVRQLADAKSKIMADITVERMQRLHQIRQQLTAEQLEKLDAMKEKRSDREKH